jgi:hypothetical protein
MFHGGEELHQIDQLGVGVDTAAAAEVLRAAGDPFMINVKLKVAARHGDGGPTSTHQEQAEPEHK